MNGLKRFQHNRMITNKEDSLKKRYLFKLGANAINIPATLVTQAIIPRGLGAFAYGQFTFLSNFFTQIVGFFDSGTSFAFYTKLSKNLQEKAIIRFYLGLTLLISTLSIALVGLIFFFHQSSLIWPNQKAIYIWLALLWGLLTWYSQILNYIVDAYGMTVRAEIVRLQQKVLALVLILIVYFYNALSLVNFFIYNYITIVFLCLAWWYILWKNNISIFDIARLTLVQIKYYCLEFYRYSMPLVTYALAGMLVGILDTWLLQKFAGSVQQGFYGLSYKISSLCFLFTGTLTPLLMREFSVAFGKQDRSRMKFLFERYIPLLYSVAAFLSVFLIVQADHVVFFFGGKEFSGAVLPVTLMASYPLHQTYGQLSGSVFYATGRTKLYRNIGLFSMALGLLGTMILIAPSSIGGLNLGATGLAVKMICLQFITVNIQLFFNSRLLGFSFMKFFSHQIYSVSLFAVLALLAKFLGNIFISRDLASFILSAALYGLLSIGLIYVIPQLVSSSRAELKSLYLQTKNRIKGSCHA